MAASAGIRSWGTSAGAKEAYLVLSGQVSDLNPSASDAVVERVPLKVVPPRPARGMVGDAPVRSTYTSRVRAGEDVPIRGCTPTQARNALVASMHPGLAAGEAGDKAKTWQEKLRARAFVMGEPRSYHTPSASASWPAPSAQSQRLAAAALAVPRQRQRYAAAVRGSGSSTRQQREAWGLASPGREGTPDLAGAASATVRIPAPREILERHCSRELLEAMAVAEGRQASKMEAEAGAEAGAEAEGAEAEGAEAEGEAAEGAEGAEAEGEEAGVPAPPAAIAFAWDHPTRLLEKIGSGQCSWGPREQRCLEAYLRQVEAGGKVEAGAEAAGGSPTPSMWGCSTPASPEGTAPSRATPCKERSCRPASAPAHSAPTTKVERIYRATMPTARPSTASGAPSRARCREACQEHSTPRPPSASEIHVARRPPPPPPPPPAASWVQRLAPSSAQERRRKRLLGTLRRRVEDEAAVSEAWAGAATVRTPEEHFAVQAALHEAIEGMTPRTVARVAPAAGAAEGEQGGGVWDERAAFGAMLSSIQLKVAQGHLLGDAEVQVLPRYCLLSTQRARRQAGASAARSRLQALQALRGIQAAPPCSPAGPFVRPCAVAAYLL